MMAHNLKPFQLHLIMFSYPGFLLCNCNLLFNRIHSLKVGEQKPALISLCHYHTVPPDIQLVGRIDFFRIPQHIHADRKPVQFFRFYRRKPRVTRGSADCVFYDFLCYGLANRLDGSDTSPKPAFFFYRNKNPRPVITHLPRDSFCHLYLLSCPHIFLYSLSCKLYIFILALP